MSSGGDERQEACWVSVATVVFAPSAQVERLLTFLQQYNATGGKKMSQLNFCRDTLVQRPNGAGAPALARGPRLAALAESGSDQQASGGGEGLLVKLLGPRLLTKAGTTPTASAIPTKTRVLGLYFSGHW
jgi:hypothetical protein